MARICAVFLSVGFIAAVQASAASASYVWSAPTSIDPAFNMSGGPGLVSCATTGDFCAAVGSALDGSGLVRTFDGTAWSKPVDLALGDPTSISCPSSSFCAVVNYEGEVVTFDGSSWSAETTIGSSYQFVSVSCTSSSFCVAVGTTPETASGVIATYYDGTWTTTTEPSLAAVSCASTTLCVAVGDKTGGGFGYAWTSTNPTSATPTWSSSDIDGSNQLNSVSCSSSMSSTLCAAVDSSGNALTYDGTNWSSADSLDSGHSLNSVSCVSGSFCAAVDATGKAFTYSSGTWSSGTSVNAIALLSVACASSSFCEAVDSLNAFSYDGSWSTTPTALGGGLTSVSCPSTSFCVAGDQNGSVLTYNGTKWSGPQRVDGEAVIASVSCPSASFCAAVDSLGNALTFDGSTWTTPQAVVGSSGGFMSVSCPSSSFCAAVDFGGNATTFDGNWSSAKNLITGQALETVSCPSATFCLAVAGNGDPFTFSGRGWSGPGTSIDDEGVDSVSCPSNTSCTEVDGVGDTARFNGSSWTPPQTIDTANENSPAQDVLESVSCPSEDFCGTVDGGGYGLTYIDGSWSTPSNIDGNEQLGSISCVTDAVCIAVDDDGNVVQGHLPPPSATSQPTVSGTTTVGHTLTEGHASWTNDATGYTYQWQLCDAAGSSCTDISGATHQSYALISNDAGHRLRVQEHASNLGGMSLAPASSDPTGVVSSAPGPTVTFAGPVKATSRGVTFSLTCQSPSGGGCQVVAHLATVEKLLGKRVYALKASASRRHTKRIQIGSSSVFLASGQTKRITVALSQRGIKLLAHWRRMPAKLQVTLVNASVVKTLSQATTIKAKKKHKRR